MKIKAIKTSIFKPDEDLFQFILKYIKKLQEGDIVVITSKIVALSERRYIKNYDAKMRDKIIASESEFVLRTPYTWLTIKDGTVMASAGVDESNGDGKLILLPKDSFKSAHTIRLQLKRKFKVKNLGVLITDSRLLPLRAGAVGVALGYAGFTGVRDYRGKGDIFGRKLKLSRTDVADSLATASVLCMGEGNEKKPLAIISDAPVVCIEKVNKKELYIDPKNDLYGPLFRKIIR